MKPQPPKPVVPSRRESDVARPLEANESREVRRLASGGMDAAQIAVAMRRPTVDIQADLNKVSQWVSSKAS